MGSKNHPNELIQQPATVSQDLHSKKTAISHRVKTPEKATFTSAFTHINDGFTCENCGFGVLPRKSSCRNHCPKCLVSKHVDVFPGDRSNPCQGLMDLVGYQMTSNKGLVLKFRCRKCRLQTQNIAAHEDSVQADDFDQILRQVLAGQKI